MKLVLISFIISLCSNAFAVDAQSIIRRSDHVNALIQRNAYNLTYQQLLDVENLLYSVEMTVRQGQTPLPPSSQTTYEAQCWADDDTQFDFNQFFRGNVKGTISQMLRDCEFLTRSAYGTNSSYSINNIKVYNVSYYDVTADCHIDDDTQFDFDQIVLGKVAAGSAVEAQRLCALIANATYPNLATAGIKNLNLGRAKPQNYRAADCHIDDDTSFDWDQFVIGTVWGNQLSDLTYQCQTIARMIFPVGTGAVKNIR